MASLNMSTSYPLKEKEIDLQVRMNKIGNYALGHVSNGIFYPKYVGRSDNDLNVRLKQHIGEYKRFKFSNASTALAAWKKECHNYHDHKSLLDNEIHPARPKGESKKENPCPARKTCDD